MVKVITYDHHYKTIEKQPVSWVGDGQANLSNYDSLTVKAKLTTAEPKVAATLDMDQREKKFLHRWLETFRNEIKEEGRAGNIRGMVARQRPTSARYSNSKATKTF